MASKPERRTGRWRRAREYAAKRRGAAVMGLVLGVTLGTPALIVGIQALVRGEGQAAVVWIGYSLLIAVTWPSFFLWKSRGD